MDAEVNFLIDNKKKNSYKELISEQKELLLKLKDERNTQQATDRPILQLNDFLALKSKPNIDDISDLDLGEVLSDFYCSVQPQKKNDYSVQSLKCLRAALNRHFRTVRGINIVKLYSLRPRRMVWVYITLINQFHLWTWKE